MKKKKNESHKTGENNKKNWCSVENVMMEQPPPIVFTWANTFTYIIGR